MDDTTPPTARLLVDGQSTDVILQGAVLEAAVERADGAILILSEDVPWEEGLHVHLLGPDWRLRDSLSMGWPYTPGLFSDLRVDGPDAIEFNFPGETRWRVTVLPSRKWAVPLPDWWPGVSRPTGWWRWLEPTRLTR